MLHIVWATRGSRLDISRDKYIPYDYMRPSGQDSIEVWEFGRWIFRDEVAGLEYIFDFNAEA